MYALCNVGLCASHTEEHRIQYIQYICTYHTKNDEHLFFVTQSPPLTVMEFYWSIGPVRY